MLNYLNNNSSASLVVTGIFTQYQHGWFIRVQVDNSLNWDTEKLILSHLCVICSS